MKIEHGKTLNDEQRRIVNNIANDCNILIDTARLLFYREIDTTAKAKRFLNPGKKHFYDPYLMNGIKEAVDRIRLAKRLNQKVLVFGDYDADGVSATTILYNCLKEFGVNAKFTVPEREEGYGLGIDKIMKIKAESGLDLVITVDCGISDNEAVKTLQENGIDVIVTDHHEPPEVLPSCVCINPKIKGNGYPFDGLCGTGVAYKLCVALIGEKANTCLDLVALATVADSMDLVDENRDLVYEGLKLFNSKNLRSAFKYLITDTSKIITSQTLAYQVAPRVNAGGRMGDANCALKLFTSNLESEIYDCAVKLNEYNIARQTECDLIYRQAKSIILTQGLEKDRVIICYDENWKTGFVGIVAARLVEEYNRPVIVFAGADGYLKGSARSVQGLNIFNAIAYSKEYLLGYGGHAQAAGVSVDKSNFENLRKKLNEYVDSLGVEFGQEKTIYVDAQLTSPVNVKFAKEIQSLEPFGVGNRKPLFSVLKNSIVSLPIKKDSPHFSFSTPEIDMLDFNGEKNVALLSLPIKKQLVFEINYSVFRNTQSVKGIIKNVVLDYSDIQNTDLFVLDNQLKNILTEETDFIVEKNKIIKDGYGILYAVSDVRTLNKIGENLNVSMFSPPVKSGENCIVVSPTHVPENYEKVEYLDYPLSVINTTVPIAVNVLDVGCKYLDELSTDRNVFAEIYSYMLNCKGKKFTSTWEFYLHNKPDFDAYNFIFAVNVFIELGFLLVDEGVIKTGKFQKKPLINSVIYSKIQSLKG